MNKKIENTFSKAAGELVKLERVFTAGGKLENAVMEAGGDIDTLATVKHHIQEAVKALTAQPLTEGVLDSDDDDGFMARSQLYFMARDAIKLHGMINDTDDLEPWVQSKIAQAAQAIDSVSRYTEYNAAVGGQPEADMDESMMAEDPSKPSFPVKVKLAGDSIWDEEGPGKNPESVMVTDYDMEEDGNYISVTVKHDGPWSIYTDSGFEAAISNMIGTKVEFSEQGMQKDGVAHLEGVLNENIAEGMNFDDKRNDDLKEIAKDMFEYAKKAASKKVK